MLCFCKDALMLTDGEGFYLSLIPRYNAYYEKDTFLVYIMHTSLKASYCCAEIGAEKDILAVCNEHFTKWKNNYLQDNT